MGAIKDWTEQDLARFVQRVTDGNLPPAVLAETVTARDLEVLDNIILSPQVVTRLKAYLGLP